MDVIDCTEWEATVRVGEQLVVVEVPEPDRATARYSVDLRPFVRVRPTEGLPKEKLDHARDKGLVAMIRRQQDSFS